MDNFIHDTSAEGREQYRRRLQRAIIIPSSESGDSQSSSAFSGDTTDENPSLSAGIEIPDQHPRVGLESGGAEDAPFPEWHQYLNPMTENASPAQPMDSATHQAIMLQCVAE